MAELKSTLIKEDLQVLLDSVFDGKISGNKNIEVGLTTLDNIFKSLNTNIQLGDDAGVNKLNIKNLTGTVTTSITSNGVIYTETVEANSFVGPLTGNATSADKVNNSLTFGSGLTSTTPTYDGSAAITVEHADTSSQASSNSNTNGTIIQNVTLDTYGHITSLGTYNLDNRYYTETEADSRFVNVTGDSMSGDLTVNGNFRGKSNTYVDGTLYVENESNVYSTIHVKSPDSGGSYLYLYGSGTQGTGVMYVGQEIDHGGGVFYNGDGSPAFATGEVSDRVSFFRRSNGVDYVVFDYAHNSDNVNFNGIINAAGIINANAGISTTNIDASGTITGSLSGNASTATALQTGRTIGLSGDVTATGVAFDGSANITLATVVGDDSHSHSNTTLSSIDWSKVLNKPDPTLTLSGDVSGSATFSNLGNATLTVTVSDDSHNHIIGNIDSLQTELDSLQTQITGNDTDISTNSINIGAVSTALSDHQGEDATDAVHGATSEATVSTLVSRDDNGRSMFNFVLAIDHFQIGTAAGALSVLTSSTDGLRVDKDGTGTLGKLSCAKVSTDGTNFYTIGSIASYSGDQNLQTTDDVTFSAMTATANIYIGQGTDIVRLYPSYNGPLFIYDNNNQVKDVTCGNLTCTELYFSANDKIFHNDTYNKFVFLSDNDINKAKAVFCGGISTDNTNFYKLGTASEKTVAYFDDQISTNATDISTNASNLTTHEDLTGTSAHGGSTAALADSIVVRDGSGNIYANELFLGDNDKIFHNEVDNKFVFLSGDSINKAKAVFCGGISTDNTNFYRLGSIVSYSGDQNLSTTDNPSFASVTLTNNLELAASSKIEFANDGQLTYNTSNDDFYFYMNGGTSLADLHAKNVGNSSLTGTFDADAQNHEDTVYIGNVIIKTGRISGTANFSHSFGTAFPNRCMSCVATFDSKMETNGSIRLYNISKTGFSVDDTGYDTGEVCVAIQYIAIGY